MTRNTSAMPVLRSSHVFNWEEIISGDPEKRVKKQPYRKSLKSYRSSASLSCVSLPFKRDCVPILKQVGWDEKEIIPTPAMLEVIARKKRRSSYQAWNKKGRDSRCSHVSSSYSTPNTAEMNRVIRRREELRLQELSFNCDTNSDSEISDDEVVHMTRLAKRRQDASPRHIKLQVKKSTSAIAAIQKTFNKRSGAVKSRAKVLSRRS